MEIEEKKVEITMKFYLPDNREQFFYSCHAMQMRDILWDIKDACRNQLKYMNDEGSTHDFAQKIKDICLDIDLDMAT